MTEINNSDLPESIIKRLESLDSEVNRIISTATNLLKTPSPPKVSFEFGNRAPQDFLTEDERAQSIGFITKYEDLPANYSVQLTRQGDRFHIANMPYLRHVLNDFRPLIQNQDDSIHYQNIHNTWRAMLTRESPVSGTKIMVYDQENKDITPLFIQVLSERNQAISFVKRPLDYDYLYNGVIQHCDPRHSKRFLEDYTSGEWNYILWKHVQILGFVKDMLYPYYRLINCITFPKLGAL